MPTVKKEQTLGEGSWHGTESDYQRLGEYCIDDVRSEIALFEATPEISPFEREVYLMNERVNDRGIPIDLESVDHALDLQEWNAVRLNTELSQMTQGAVQTSGQIEKFRYFLKDNGCDLDSLNVDSVKTALAGELTPVARRALEIRSELSRSSGKKLIKMRNQAINGRVRGCHLYFGASTGRFSGMGIQPQNFPRGSVDYDHCDLLLKMIRNKDLQGLDFYFGGVGNAIASSVRWMIKAAKGHRFIVSDFSSIEAVVLAWVAGQSDLLRNFRDGRCPYVEMGPAVYGRPITKEEDPKERAVCKVAVLGSGYQMGWERYRDTLFAWEGIEISDDEARRVIEAYRTKNNRIVEFWAAMKELPMLATESSGPYEYRNIQFQREGDFLKVRLPSGSILSYFKPRIETLPTPWGPRPTLTYLTRVFSAAGMQRRKSYGGLVTENVVQALARDLLCSALIRLEKNGYPVIMHVHDEAVTEPEMGFGSVSEVNQIMADNPFWASTIPVSASTFESSRFRKD